MRVIIEGPDGGGKTNMIERLQKKLSWLSLAPRASDSVKGPVPDLVKYIEDDLYNHDGEHRLYDRHPLISEPIYGPVIRAQMQFDDRGVGWLADMMGLFYQYAPVLIYCIPPWEEVNRNIQEGVHMSGVSVNAKKIYQLYVAAYCREVASHHNVYRWNYTQPGNLDNILYSIEGAGF